MALQKFDRVLLLVVVAWQLSTAFGFQTAIRSKTISGDGMRSSQFINTPFLRRSTEASSKLQIAATPQEEQAVVEFKMITEEEARLRKIGGIVLGVVTITIFLTRGHDYANLSTGAFAALSTYRTGAEYQ